MDSPGVSGAAKGLIETQKRLKQAPEAPEAGKKKIKIRGLQTPPLMVRYHLSSGSGGMADALDSGSSGS